MTVILISNEKKYTLKSKSIADIATFILFYTDHEYIPQGYYFKKHKITTKKSFEDAEWSFSSNLPLNKILELIIDTPMPDLNLMYKTLNYSSRYDGKIQRHIPEN